MRALAEEGNPLQGKMAWLGRRADFDCRGGRWGVPHEEAPPVRGCGHAAGQNPSDVATAMDAAESAEKLVETGNPMFRAVSHLILT